MHAHVKHCLSRLVYPRMVTGDFSPFWHLTSYPGRLSLAIPRWVIGAMSISDGNGHMLGKKTCKFCTRRAAGIYWPSRLKTRCWLLSKPALRPTWGRIIALLNFTFATCSSSSSSLLISSSELACGCRKLQRAANLQQTGCNGFVLWSKIFFNSMCDEELCTKLALIRPTWGLAVRRACEVPISRSRWQPSDHPGTESWHPVYQQDTYVELRPIYMFVR